MSQQTQTTLDIEKIIATRQDPAASSAVAPSALEYGEVAVDINGVLRTGNKNKQVVTHVVSTDSRLTDTRNPRANALTNQNLNDITTPGFYYAGGGNTVTNKPSGIAAFGLLVEQTASGYRSQLLIGGDSLPNKMFIRQYTSTAWGAWSSFYTTAYKPTLSELGAAAATHTHTKSQITDFPTSLKNPTSIKIQLNNGTSEGTNQFTYDGSAAKNINITPSSIGAAASSHTHSYLPLSGGTMTGAITLPGNPTSNLHAATKQYVDSQIAGSGSGDMLKSVYDTDNDGIVDKAEKLGTARTIGLGEAAVSTATSFDGSQNITIPVTSVRESYLSWGGKGLSGAITPIDTALADFASGNRLFGTPASSISVEVSRNGGSTWSDYPGVTDGRKRSLVSTGTSYSLGGVGSGNTTQDQLRVTITAGSFYFFCRKVLMNVSTNGATGMKVNIKYSTIGTPDTFKDYGTFSLSGWSGWNSIPLSMSWGGGSSQTTQTKKVQFTFSMTGAGPATVLAIYAYGENAWGFPNVMAKYGRSYDVDYDCNSTFRGKVTLKQDPSSNLEAATKQYVDKGAISTYTHSKSGTVHTLTGSGDNIRFVATADFTSGDTFKIGTSDVTAKTIGGDSLWTGFFKNGAVVTCYKNGTTINFNGGGLPASELAKLTPENIKSGIKITANGKTVTGTFTNDGTATQDDILLGQTAYVAGVKLTGRIPKAPSSTPATGSGDSGGQFYLTTQEGFYAEGTKLTKPSEEMGAAIGLTAGVLKTGTTIGGVRGTYTSDANAAASNILSGKTAYVNGSKITGNMPNYANGTPNAIDAVRLQNNRFEIAPARGYHGYSWADGNYSYLTYSQVANTIGLTAAKIAKGNTILGIAGTYDPSPSGTIVWCGYGITQNEANEDVAINSSILQGSPYFRVDSSLQITCTKACTIKISFNYWRYTQAGLSATLSIRKNGVQVTQVYVNTDQVQRYTSSAISFNVGDKLTMRTIGQNASFRKDGCFAYIN